MKLATVRTPAGNRAACVIDERVQVLDLPDAGAVLEGPGLDAVSGLTVVEELELAETSFAPLVPRARKIVCVGMNYKSHIAEMGHDQPSHPTLFAKFASSLLGPHDDLVLPSVSATVDWEAELGVVIGAPVWRADAARARAAIAGFTVVNDISMRDWQNRTSQFLQGKAFEASTPVGPYLVTGDELDDAADLEVRCELDGSTVQSGRTSDMLFGPAEVVSYISQFARLEPGDLISTGTPSGVGAGRRPPVFLKAGQVVTTIVERIGACRNRCVAET